MSGANLLHPRERERMPSWTRESASISSRGRLPLGKQETLSCPRQTTGPCPGVLTTSAEQGQQRVRPQQSRLGAQRGCTPPRDGASSEAWTQVQGPRGAERGAGNPAYPALLSAQGKQHRKCTEQNSSNTGTRPRSSPTQADWNSVCTVFLADFNTRGLQFLAA